MRPKTIFQLRFALYFAKQGLCLTIGLGGLLAFWLLSSYKLTAQQTGQKLEEWPAKWISTARHQEVLRQGVVHFALPFELGTKPTGAVEVDVAADQGYQLYVNGKLVRRAHNNGDLEHYRYQTVNIGPYLLAGSNVVSALVWNQAFLAQDPLISHQLAFILKAHTPAFAFLNTDRNWFAIDEAADRFRPAKLVYGYYHAGPTEVVGLSQEGFVDHSQNPQAVIRQIGTKAATRFWKGSPAGYTWTGFWKLVPDQLPPMLDQKLGSPDAKQSISPVMMPQPIVRTEYDAVGAKVLPTMPSKLAPQSKVKVLVDMQKLVTAYPELTIDGGAGGIVVLRYDEALFDPADPKHQTKGDRNVVKGKVMQGYEDTIYLHKGSNHFRPIWWRTYRYLELTIQTKDSPVERIGLDHWLTYYPFNATNTLTLVGDQDTSLTHKAKQMMDIGQRTLQLCAHETFMDCPYYEQSQYVGDTRIEGLVSYLNFGDPTLWRQAIKHFEESRGTEGLTKSRWPSRLSQRIPGFSLWWVGMVYDYALWTGDSSLVADVWPGVESVMTYFAKLQRPDGTLADPGHWDFVDWSWTKTRGKPSLDSGGRSAVLDFHYQLARKYAQSLAHRFHQSTSWEHYGKAGSTSGVGSLAAQYFDGNRGYYQDNTTGNEASQHVNILALLSGAEQARRNYLTKPDVRVRPINSSFLMDTALMQTTIYYSFYRAEAMRALGQPANDYVKHLGIWDDQLKLNLSTWAEEPEPSRSDCHAWGSSPNYHFYTMVLGITHDVVLPILDTETAEKCRYKNLSWGPEHVYLQPHLGHLRQAKGSLSLEQRTGVSVDYMHHERTPKLDKAARTINGKGQVKSGWLVTVKLQRPDQKATIVWDQDHVVGEVQGNATSTFWIADDWQAGSNPVVKPLVEYVMGR
jgi:hypothetical protein